MDVADKIQKISKEGITYHYELDYPTTIYAVIAFVVVIVAILWLSKKINAI